MYKVISVRIEDTGSIEFFSVDNIDVEKDNSVVVDIDGILELGTCVSVVVNKCEKEVALPLYKIV